MLPVIGREAADFLVAACRRAREARECKLRNIHAGADDDGHIVLIRELEGNTQEMARVDDACRVVDHKTDTSERGLSSYLDEVFIRTEVFLGCPEYEHAGVQHEFAPVRHDDLAGCGIDLLRWVDDVRLTLFVHDELIAEPDIIARWLKACRRKRLEHDVARLQGLLDVDIGK